MRDRRIGLCIFGSNFTIMPIIILIMYNKYKRERCKIKGQSSNWTPKRLAKDLIRIEKNWKDGNDLFRSNDRESRGENDHMQESLTHLLTLRFFQNNFRSFANPFNVLIKLYPLWEMQHKQHTHQLYLCHARGCACVCENGWAWGCECVCSACIARNTWMNSIVPPASHT